jgi:hypothetical protein
MIPKGQVRWWQEMIFFDRFSSSTTFSSWQPERMWVLHAIIWLRLKVATLPGGLQLKQIAEGASQASAPAMPVPHSHSPPGKTRCSHSWSTHLSTYPEQTFARPPWKGSAPS